MGARIEIAAGEQRRMLPVILIAAVVQGWALYGLHFSIKQQIWPATAPGWLLAFYAVAGFVPITVQLLASYSQSRVMWRVVVLMAAAFWYFGWHHGLKVADQPTTQFIESGVAFPLAFVLAVLWTMCLPFLQCRLHHGAWRVAYHELFAATCRNLLLLGEAALFTALLWFLLFLWQELFHMLNIDYFRALFSEPVFVYPVTSLSFGLALHLIGSLDRLTSIVLEQVLTVLKWLAVVAGLILVLFSAALLVKLPGLVTQGERAIDARWLLWLVAVIVLLVNAAYRDGSVAQPYPRWIAGALKCVIPLTILIAATALYAFWVRVHEYGFTVDRVWGFIVAGTALVYALGYGTAAFGRGGWMSGIARVNVMAALGLIAVIALTLTPVLSPYRIAANSQYRRALRAPVEPVTGTSWQATPFHYLRFEAGRYGTAKLQVLAALTDGLRAAEIRKAAQSAMAQENRWLPPAPQNLDSLLAQLATFPQGRALDPALRSTLATALRKPDLAPLLYEQHELAGVYVDLDGDGRDEFVLLLGPRGYAYRQADEGWTAIGPMVTDAAWREDAHLRALRDGDVSADSPRWKELRIGSLTYRLARPGTAKP